MDDDGNEETNRNKNKSISLWKKIYPESFSFLPIYLLLVVVLPLVDKGGNAVIKIPQNFEKLLRPAIKFEWRAVFNERNR